MKLPCLTTPVTNAFRIPRSASGLPRDIFGRLLKSRGYSPERISLRVVQLSSEDRSRAREVPEEFLLPTQNDITYLVAIAPATSPKIRAFVTRRIRCRFLKDRRPPISPDLAPFPLSFYPNHLVVSTSNVSLLGKKLLLFRESSMNIQNFASRIVFTAVCISSIDHLFFLFTNFSMN